MPDVFISYAHQNRDSVRRLVKSINDKFSVYWDDGLCDPRLKKTTGLAGGEGIREGITYSIEDSKCVVVCWTKEAVNSRWVPNEAELASIRHKCVPVVLDEVEVPIDFRNLNVIDLSGWAGNPNNRQYQKLLFAINKTIKKTQKTAIKKRQPRSRRIPIKFLDPLALGTADSHCIGVHVGTTRIGASIIKISNTEIVEYLPEDVIEIDHDGIDNAERIEEKIISVIDELLDKAEIDIEGIKGVGIALPGQVNRENGLLSFAPGLKIHHGVNFTTHVSDYYNGTVQVHADNDINCATLTELALGCGRSFKDFVCVYFGTGIGAGIVVNHQMVRGHNSSAGEIGHIKIHSQQGSRDCTCGKAGCYEEYASARGMIRQARARIVDLIDKNVECDLIHLDLQNINPKDIVKLIKVGDREAKKLANCVAENISIGLANIANILNPEAIVLGGGIIEGFYGFTEFQDKIIQGLHDRAIKACHPATLLQASFKRHENGKGRMALIIGAALLPFERGYVR